MKHDGHYFEENPSSEEIESSVQLSLPDFTCSLKTASNVFSWQKIDSGTKFFLLNVPTPQVPPNNVLDLGCGYGPITAVLEHRFPNGKVWGIDVNNRAIDLAKRNVQKGSTVICKPDEVPEEVTFDLIWSNPTIRIGKQNLKILLTTWLNRLNLNGSAFFVINKNLGSDSIQQWLENETWTTSRLKSVRGYRLIEVRHND